MPLSLTSRTPNLETTESMMDLMRTSLEGFLVASDLAGDQGALLVLSDLTRDSIDLVDFLDMVE